MKRKIEIATLESSCGRKFSIKAALDDGEQISKEYVSAVIKDSQKKLEARGIKFIDQ